MPKHKRKGKAPSSRTRADADSDDETAMNDNMSVISNASSGSAFRDELDDTMSASVDEATPSGGVAVEDQLDEVIEMASQKSANGRTEAIKNISKAFMAKLMPDFVHSRIATLTDVVDRSLKRGKDAEQEAACRLAIIITIQIGNSPAAETVLETLRPLLTTRALDPAASPRARAAACHALGTLCFLVSEPEDFAVVMATLEKVFEPATKTSAAVKCEPEFAEMYTEALAAWTLLLTLMSPAKGKTILESYVDHLSHLFESTDVEVRITSGEALVVLFELAAEVDDEEAFALVNDFVPVLKQLATDSHKYRSKKDRKEQKSSFRDILRTIDGDGDSFFERISFSGREPPMQIDSWAMKRQYDNMCKALGSGMNLHLTENELLREIFQLGAIVPPESNVNQQKPSKLERHHANLAADKVRNQMRGKHRDKRSAVI